jgi:hypothetical protein
MNSIYTYFYSLILIMAFLLAAFLSGCKDNVVGVDGFCPIVESTNPANLATNVSLNTVITVTFEEKINPGTMNQAAFSLSSGTVQSETLSGDIKGDVLLENAKSTRGVMADAGKTIIKGNAENELFAGEVSGTMTFDNASNTMSFTPDSPLSSNTVYTGRVINTIEDPLGNRMLEDYVWSFTTEEASATIPTVVSSSPQNGADNVALNAIVSATFSHTMNAGTLNPATFTLFDGATQINGAVSYNNLTASFVPNSNLAAETTYTATITTGAQNNLGVALENNFVWSFTTDEAGVITSPTVVSTNPQDGADDVVLNTVVSAAFSQTMNPATLNQSTFTLFDGATQINGSVSYINLTATFVPNNNLSAETTYTATITTGAQNNMGTGLESNFVWSFTTDEAGVITGPTVVSTIPQDGDIDVALDVTVSAIFSQVMNPATLNQSTFTLFDGSTQINGSVSYANLIASFEPDSDLSPETTYTATITTGAQNNMGTGIDSNFVWSFTTDEAGVITGPTVVSTIPQDGDVDVALDVTVSAIFSQVMNPATLNQSTFTLFDGSTQINGSVSYANLIASFEPDSDLSPETTYTATITTGAENNMGTSLEEDYIWTFTTEAEDLTNPMVISTNPEDGDENVVLNVNVSADFNQAMNPASINDATFTLYDGAIQIDGTVSYANITATFIPDNNLSTETTYTATITTGAENEMGNSLEEDFVWTFTTGTSQTTPPDMGSTETYGIMATAAITNTGGTVINGDVSLDPGTSLSGFPPGVINGTLNINNSESAQAREDLLQAYNELKTLPPGVTIPAGSDLGSLYPNGIPPGTYTSGSTMLVTTTLVLDAGGDVNAVWVFQIGSSLTTGADVTLTGGADENNVFWVPTEDATIGVGTTFHGTIVSGRDVTANTGAIIYGRILAGAVTDGTIALDNNTVNVPGFE